MPCALRPHFGTCVRKICAFLVSFYVVLLYSSWREGLFLLLLLPPQMDTPSFSTCSRLPPPSSALSPLGPFSHARCGALSCTGRSCFPYTHTHKVYVCVYCVYATGARPTHNRWNSPQEVSYLNLGDSITYWSDRIIPLQ